MVKKKKAVKVVLDTNVIVSAILFRGEIAKLHTLWKKGVITPIISKDTFEELTAVFKYSKFYLSDSEIRAILEEEVLPYFYVQEITRKVRGVCRDSDDDKFLSCALSASAEFIVSGDKDLIELKKYKSVKIIKPSVFLKKFD